MKAEAVITITDSDVPRPPIVSNATREFQTPTSEKQGDQFVDVEMKAETVMMTVDSGMLRVHVHRIDRI